MTSNRDATKRELNSPPILQVVTMLYHPQHPKFPRPCYLLVEQTPRVSLQLSCTSLSLGSSLVGPDFCRLIPPELQLRSINKDHRLARVYISTFAQFFLFQPINLQQQITHSLSSLYHPPLGVIATR